jgi:hypothetical protein
MKIPCVRNHTILLDTIALKCYLAEYALPAQAGPGPSTSFNAEVAPPPPAPGEAPPGYDA